MTLLDLFLHPIHFDLPVGGVFLIAVLVLYFGVLMPRPRARRR